MKRVLLKHRAKRSMMEPRRPNLFLVTILYTLIAMMLGLIISDLTDYGRISGELWDNYNAYTSDMLNFGRATFILPEIYITVSGALFFIAATALTWMMDLGYLIYARGIVAGEQVDHRTLFESFNYFGKGLLLRLIKDGLYYIALPFALIPAWIVMCMYAQAYYLMLDNPDRGVIWCLRESRRMMRGHKMEYFMLRLSFLGWELLALFPYIRYAAYMWVIPYREITLVHYYNDMTGQNTEPYQGWERPGM